VSEARRDDPTPGSPGSRGARDAAAGDRRAKSARDVFKLLKIALSLLSLGLVERFAAMAFTVVAARHLGQYAFGAYSLIQTLLTVGGLVTGAGIEFVVVRVVSQNRAEAPRVFRAVLLLLLALVVPAWAAIIVTARLMGYPSEVWALVELGGAALIGMAVSQACVAMLKALERMEIFASTSGVLSILFSAAGIFAILGGRGLRVLVWLLIAKSVIDAAVLLYVTHARFVPIALRWDGAAVRSLLRHAAPVTLLVAFAILLRRLDLLIVGRLKGLNDVAVYAAAVRLTDFLTLMSASFVGALFPMLSARWGASREASRRLYEQSVAFFSVLGFPIAFGTTILAAPILELLFDQSYAEGSLALSLLAWSYLLTLVQGPAGLLLIIAADRLGKLNWIAALIVLGNVALNLILVPRFSYHGAAAAAVICSIATYAVRDYMVRHYFAEPIDVARIVVRPLVASIVMSAAMLGLGGADLFVRVAAGAVTYTATLATIGEFRNSRYDGVRGAFGWLLHKTRA
jgi:O-antigen/teichoic acid export membrane protein